MKTIFSAQWFGFGTTITAWRRETVLKLFVRKRFS